MGYCKTIVKKEKQQVWVVGGVVRVDCHMNIESRNSKGLLSLQIEIVFPAFKALDGEHCALKWTASWLIKSLEEGSKSNISDAVRQVIAADNKSSCHKWEVGKFLRRTPSGVTQVRHDHM